MTRRRRGPDGSGLVWFLLGLALLMSYYNPLFLD